VSFIENSFSLTDDTYFNIDQFPTAKAAAADGAFPTLSGLKHISTRQVSTILDYVLALSVMRNATDDEVNDVFDRINTYGHRLSDQERRQHIDDYRALNLVEVLAAVRRQGRQVIVAVEDSALADLLCRRLRSKIG